MHKNEIYKKFIKNAEETHRQIDRFKNEKCQQVTAPISYGRIEFIKKND